MQGKSFEIPKELVWKSYQAVRKNRGAAGCDGQTVTNFDENRDANLYKIWNRLCSGSYFPPPVLEKQIPKSDGRKRTLGIPTVSDRIAQGAVKIFVEEKLEPIFHPDSYGYRPNRSAHQALQRCEERCRIYNWVLEIDVKGFFDNVRHDLIIKALEHHQMPKWVVLYCKRWLEAPMQARDREAELSKRSKGTPQGGVVSPLLANLFLHYAFDQWMKKRFRFLPFERYADDIICHCANRRDALSLKENIKQRLHEVGLAINEEKSKIAYIDTFERRNVSTCFTFLGYDFKVRTLKNHEGKLFRKCKPGASKKAMRHITQTIKHWRIHRCTTDNAKVIANRYNSTLRGWIEYYGKFWYRNFSYHLWSVFQSRLVKWMKSKFRISTKAAKHRLRLLRKEQPKLFAHWDLLRGTNE